MAAYVMLCGRVLLLVLMAAIAEGYEGFGSGVTLGSTSVYTVTHLGDSGAGSLREAVSQCCRTVRFGVSGDLWPSSEIRVRGERILIDGLTAPAPGVTLRGRGLLVRGTEGANNVIVRGLRIRDAANDGVHVGFGAWNVVLDRLSIGLSQDGQIDITEGARNVTVTDSFLVGDKVMLIKFGNARRVSVLRSFLVGAQRNPQVSAEGVAPTDLHADIRNNLIVQVSPPTLHGTLVWFNGVANVIGNLYIGPRAADAVVVQSPYVHTSGNRMYAGTGDPNTFGTWPTAFAVPSTTTLSACAAAGVAANAGVPWADDALEAGVLTWLGSYIAGLPAGQGC